MTTAIPADGELGTQINTGFSSTSIAIRVVVGTCNSQQVRHLEPAV